jgi:lysophospholipase L1-like esterase
VDLSDERYLALGDSYTAGEGVAPAESWPARLAEYLTAGGRPFGPPEVIARTGWTAADLAAAVATAAPRGPLALVTLLVGANDHYRGRPLAAYEADFDPLLTRARELAGHGVLLVVSIPDWTATPFGRQHGGDALSLQRFNEANRRAAAARGVLYLDLTAGAPPGEAEQTGPDGLHPTATLHAAWARRAYLRLMPALGRTAAGD